MNVAQFRDFCLSKKGVTGEFPFDETTLVFKVMGKIFAITDLDTFETLNLKGLPERNAERCESFPEVTPGYHMNKRHWITVRIDGTLADRQVFGWVEESYDLVVRGLTRTKRLMLESL